MKKTMCDEWKKKYEWNAMDKARGMACTEFVRKEKKNV